MEQKGRCRCCGAGQEKGQVHMTHNPERDYSALLRDTLALGLPRVQGVPGQMKHSYDGTDELMICRECINKLNAAHQFKLQVIQANDYFRNVARASQSIALPKKSDMSNKIKFEKIEIDERMSEGSTVENNENIKLELCTVPPVHQNVRSQIKCTQQPVEASLSRRNEKCELIEFEVPGSFKLQEIHNDWDIIEESFEKCIEKSRKLLDDYESKLISGKDSAEMKDWEIQSRIFEELVCAGSKYVKTYEDSIGEIGKDNDSCGDFVYDSEKEGYVEMQDLLKNVKKRIGKKNKRFKEKTRKSLVEPTVTEINCDQFNANESTINDVDVEQTDTKKIYLVKVTNGQKSEIKVTHNKNVINKMKDMTIEENFVISKNELKCKLCTKTLLSHAQAMTHIYTHNQTTFMCDLCGESFLTKRQFQMHHKKHKIEENSSNIPSQDTSVEGNFHMIGSTYHCNHCKDSFRNRKHAVTHLHTHYPNYICDLCGKSFAWLKHLNSHRHLHRTTKGLPGYICNICGHQFKLRESLRYHVRGHSILLNKCPHCPERFKYYTHKQKHLVAVHDYAENTYKCKVCPKSFSTATSLSNHVKKIHKKLRPYHCTQCEMKFYTRYLLKGHMTKHTGVKEFECNVCGKLFSRKYNMKEHMKCH